MVDFHHTLHDVIFERFCFFCVSSGLILLLKLFYTFSLLLVLFFRFFIIYYVTLILVITRDGRYVIFGKNDGLNR